jgi:hypothetical protein
VIQRQLSGAFPWHATFHLDALVQPRCGPGAGVAVTALACKSSTATIDQFRISRGEQTAEPGNSLLILAAQHVGVGFHGDRRACVTEPQGDCGDWYTVAQ